MTRNVCAEQTPSSALHGSTAQRRAIRQSPLLRTCQSSFDHTRHIALLRISRACLQAYNTSSDPHSPYLVIPPQSTGSPALWQAFSGAQYIRDARRRSYTLHAAASAWAAPTPAPISCVECYTARPARPRLQRECSTHEHTHPSLLTVSPARAHAPHASNDALRTRRIHLLVFIRKHGLMKKS